jgi:hypothetical protein
MWLPCAEQRMIFILAPQSPFVIKCYFRLNVVLEQSWSKIRKLRKRSHKNFSSETISFLIDPRLCIIRESAVVLLRLIVCNSATDDIYVYKTNT